MEFDEEQDEEEEEGNSNGALKGAVSATPLFLFTSGNDKLNCLKEAPTIYPVTKRNS